MSAGSSCPTGNDRVFIKLNPAQPGCERRSGGLAHSWQDILFLSMDVLTKLKIKMEFWSSNWTLKVCELEEKFELFFNQTSSH